MFKKIVIASFFLLIVSGGPALAAEITIPEFNPLCWKEKDCCDVRAAAIGKDKCENLSADDRKSGWVTGEKPCDQKDWGKCLPAGQITTQIKFAGKTQFAHIGQFIQVMYRYFLTIAGIVAVGMIMIAGVQWVTSGGNSEMITSAKKRIGGALIGLFLAYISYFILNTINPALVNFRLPQIWMLRSQKALTQFCSELPKEIKEGKNDAEKNFFQVADATKEEQSKKIEVPKAVDYNMTFKNAQPSDKNEANFYCGKRFLVQGSGNTTCLGDFCSSQGQMCSNFDEKAQDYYFCGDTTMWGNITYTPLLGETGCISLTTHGWEKPEITDVSEEELWAVCNNGQMSEVDDAIVSGSTHSDSQVYFIRLDTNGWKEFEDEIALCKASRGDLKGFVIKFEMNESCDPKDENHWVGMASGESVDLGDDGFFLDNVKKIDKQYFISAEQIRQKGLHLNLNADKVNDIDNDAVDRKPYEAYLSK